MPMNPYCKSWICFKVEKPAPAKLLMNVLGQNGTCKTIRCFQVLLHHAVSSSSRQWSCRYLQGRAFDHWNLRVLRQLVSQRVKLSELSPIWFFTKKIKLVSGIAVVSNYQHILMRPLIWIAIIKLKSTLSL